MIAREFNYPVAVILYCKDHYGYNLDQMNRRFIGRAQQTIKELGAELHDLRISTMMDIGCGLGATTAALATFVGASVVTLVEADAAKPVTVHGFNQTLEPWNDVNISKIMVEANVPDHVIVHARTSKELLALDPDQFGKLDLITSFRSWCHHYPASVYLDFVRRTLKPMTGRLVVDVRTKTDGMEVLTKAGFKMLAYVSQHSASLKKTGRYVFRLEV